MEWDERTSDASSSGPRTDLIRAALRDAREILRRSRTGEVPVDPAPGSPLLSVSIPGYEIIREIHRGGQGVVYLAVNNATGRKVAVKVLRDGALAGSQERARFERELQVLSRLDHPNVVGIHDSGEIGEWSYHVMDYIPGQPLDDYVASAGLSINKVLALFQTICEAVAAAHLRGVIHRDLKPANIRVDPEGQPHILDFGLAKFGGERSEPNGAAMTNTGQFVGSLPWSSPEQAEGVADRIDIRTDVYSLGVVLFQVLTGRFPYEVVGNMRDVLEHILRTAPLRPSTLHRKIDDEVETIVLKCLAKERERRYQSAGELARDIGHYLAGEPIEAKRDSGWYVLKKTLQRYRGRVAAVGVIVVLLAVSVVALAVLYRRSEAHRIESERQASIASAVNEFFNEDLLGSLDPEAFGRDVTMVEVLTAASSQIHDRFRDEPLVEAAVRTAVARAFDGLGRPLEAVPHLQRALELQRAALGPRHPDLLPNLIDLASAHRGLGRLEEALIAAEDAEAIASGAYGPDDETTLAAVETVAAVYYDLKRLDEAIARFDRIQESRNRAHDSGALSDEAYVRALSNFASLHNEAGRYAAAEESFRHALDEAVATLGPDHHLTLTTQYNLSMVTASLGRIDDAAVIAEECLERCRRELGPDHADTLDVLAMLASHHYLAGRPEVAEPLLRDALAAQERVNGPGAAATLDTVERLAAVTAEMGDWEASEPLFRRVCEGRTTLYGAAHPRTIRAAGNLALLYSETDRLAESIGMLRRVLEVQTDNRGRTHPDTLTTMANLAMCLRDAGELDEALELGEFVLSNRRRHFGDDHPDTLSSINNLALTQRSMGRDDLAIPLYRELLDRRSRLLGLEDPESQQCVLNLVAVYRDMGDPDAAIGVLRDWSDRCTQELGPTAQATLESVVYLGNELIEHGLHEDSMPLLREAVTGLAQAGPNAAMLDTAVVLLHRAYEALGRTQEAEELQERFPDTLDASGGGK